MARGQDLGPARPSLQAAAPGPHLSLVASPISAAERCASPWHSVPTSPPLLRGARRADCAASAWPLGWAGLERDRGLRSCPFPGSANGREWRGSGGRHGRGAVWFALSDVSGL